MSCMRCLPYYFAAFGFASAVSYNESRLCFHSPAACQVAAHHEWGHCLGRESMPLSPASTDIVSSSLRPASCSIMLITLGRIVFAHFRDACSAIHTYAQRSSTTNVVASLWPSAMSCMRAAATSTSFTAAPSSKNDRPPIALPPHALSRAKKAKCPPTTGRAMKFRPGNPPFPSVSYRSVSGRSVKQSVSMPKSTGHHRGTTNLSLFH